MNAERITAADHVDALSISLTAAAVIASAPSRMLAGDLVQYGIVGRTSRGPLRVRPGALRFPDDMRRVILTREHNRDESRGVLAAVHDGPDRMRVQVRVADGPDGDAALREATDGTRAAFSFDVIDASIDGDEITDALVIAIGQVGIPAYDDARIDTIAASNNPGEPMLTEAQRARLTELLAMTNRNAAEQTEFTSLLTIANGGTAPAAPETPPAAPAATQPAASTAPAASEPAAAESVAVAASMPAIPGGVPNAAASTTTTRPRAALRQLVTDVTAGITSGDVSAITAALSDIIHTDHTEDIEPLAWSGELWSGLQYEPQFSDLLVRDSLTYWEGKGWRFTKKLAIQDYAGDKAAIPSDTVTTEPSSYEAARMAVGVDIDRKFYDFPNEGFVNSLFEQVRESWEIKLDEKVKNWIVSNAVAGTRTVSISRTSGDATVSAPAGTFRASDVGATITGTGIPGGTTILSVTDDDEIEMSANASATSASASAVVGAQEGTVMKAAARARMILKQRKVGNASWIVLNDEDMFTLLDVEQDKVPAYLELWNVDPKNFRSSPDVAQGTLLAGVKQTGVLRTLPGSPIRVSAQNLANGGVDEAFFGYWAIEEHHTSGIVSVKFNPAA